MEYPVPKDGNKKWKVQQIHVVGKRKAAKKLTYKMKLDLKYPERVKPIPPTLEEVRERMCGKKNKYDSDSAARWQLRDMENNGAVGITEVMNIYQCRFCGKWHLGHKNHKAHPEADKRLTELLVEVSDILNEMRKRIPTKASNGKL